MDASKKTYVFVFSLVILTACYNTYQSPPPVKSESAYKFYYRALGLEKEQRYAAALTAVDSAIAHNAQIAHFFLLKGRLLERLDRNNAAIDSYRRSIELRSNNAQAWQRMGYLYRGEHDYQKAVQCLERSYNLAKSRVELLVEIANLYLNLDQLQKAREVGRRYQTVCREQNRDLSDQFRRFQAHLAGRRNYYQRVIDLLFGQRTVLIESQQDALLLLDALFKEEQFDSGFRYLSELQPTWLGRGFYHYYKGRYYFNAANYNDALGQFIIARNHPPAPEDLTVWIEKARERLKKPTK